MNIPLKDGLGVEFIVALISYIISFTLIWPVSQLRGSRTVFVIIIVIIIINTTNQFTHKMFNSKW